MNEKLLREIMTDRGIDETRMLNAVNLDKRGFSKRISGEIEFNLAEIIFISRTLNLNQNEIVGVFFS